MEYIVLTLPAFLLVTVKGAGIGEVCSNDDDCRSVPDLVCEKIYKPETCRTGQCKCKKGKKWDGGQCISQEVCSDGSTYNSNLKNCLSDLKYLIDDECQTNDDCYGETGTVVCASTCKCVTGYINDDYSCRNPHVGEECINEDVTCASMSGNDPSLAVETCQAGICKCPSGSSPVAHIVRSKKFEFCVNGYSGTQKEDGANCTEQNSCKTHFCAECPGAGYKTCLSPIGVSSKQMTSSSAVMETFICFLVLLLYQM